MTTMRIGIIADTHIPEFLPALPTSVQRVFQSVDVILHAGDITNKEVLDELRTLAPVIAVKGDHDALDLPVQTVVEVGGKRIGLVHGRRPRWQEIPSIVANDIFPGHHFAWGGFQRQVLRSFQHVDAIVFGHFHHPYLAWHRNVLLFNPGAIYQLTPERIQAELSRSPSLMRRAYLLNAYRKVPTTPSVGMLTIKDDRMQAEIIPISE